MRRVIASAVTAVVVAAVAAAPSIAGPPRSTSIVPPPHCDKSGVCPEDRLLAYLDCFMAESLTGGNPFACRY